MALQLMRRTRYGEHVRPRIAYRVTGDRHLLHLNAPARAIIPPSKDGRLRVVIHYGPGGALRLIPADVGVAEARLVNSKTGQLSIVNLSGLPGWKHGLQWEPRMNTEGNISCLPIRED